MKFGIIIAAGVLAIGTSAFAANRKANTTAPNQETWQTFTEMSGGAFTGLIWSDGTNSGYITPPGAEKITVSADVEYWATQYWDNTRIYFHKATDANPQPGIINGKVTSNFQGIVGLQAVKPSGAGTADMTKLVGPVTVPLAWSWATDAVNYTAATYPGGLQEAKFLILGPGVDIAYQIKCDPTFPPMAPVGAYEMDPSFTFTPSL